jgi:hypothetical protein
MKQIHFYFKQDTGIRLMTLKDIVQYLQGYYGSGLVEIAESDTNELCLTYTPDNQNTPMFGVVVFDSWCDEKLIKHWNTTGWDK